MAPLDAMPFGMFWKLKPTMIGSSCFVLENVQNKTPATRKEEEMES